MTARQSAHDSSDVAISKQAIACVGWGSLVHSPGGLPLRGGWSYDGPFLPVEFTRESADKRITLVLCPGAPRVQTCWALLDAPDIQSAKKSLGLREYPDASPDWITRNIGFWDKVTATSFGLEAEAVAAWANNLRLIGAVWTNLPPKFNQRSGIMPTAEQVVTHLRELEGEDRHKAENYVRRTPVQIDTPYRRLIEKTLGWTSVP